MRVCSLYVHWPYCKTKCTFCAFNKYLIPPQGQDHVSLEASYSRDLQFELKEASSMPFQIQSVYFGGGTPSLARPEFISSILHQVRPFLSRESVEVTLEVNPTSMESRQTQFIDFKKAGINRVSIGIQSLHDKELSSFNRDHTGQDALDTFQEAIQIFGNVSVDLMYGRPDQTLQDWTMELKTILGWNPSHLSLYQMMIEKGTKMHQEFQDNPCRFPSEDLYADLYNATLQLSLEHGYHQYEVSSFVKDPKHVSQHNLGYWRGMNYMGIGPGAHGRVTNDQGQRFKTFRILDPYNWMKSCQETGHGRRKVVPMTEKESILEQIVFGLRTIHGIPSNLLQKDIVDHSLIQDYCHLGLVHFQENRLKPTLKGLSVMDAILARIIV